MKHTVTRKIEDRRGARGAVIVEFVLVAGLLIFLMFGIMEMGFMMSNSLTVSSAAQQGARAAALKGDGKAVETSIYNVAKTLREPRDFSVISGNTVIEYAPEGTEDWQAWNPGNAPPDGTKDQIRVTVTYQYKYITGNLLGALGNLMSGKPGQPTDHRTLTGVSVMRYEGENDHS